jgi:hypothetical protein
VARSPIEMMVDRACGITEASPPPPQRPTPDEQTEALLAVCDAAVTWLEAKELNTFTKEHEIALEEAAERLRDMGWTAPASEDA